MFAWKRIHIQFVLSFYKVFSKYVLKSHTYVEANILRNMSLSCNVKLLSKICCLFLGKTLNQHFLEPDVSYMVEKLLMWGWNCCWVQNFLLMSWNQLFITKLYLSHSNKKTTNPPSVHIFLFMPQLYVSNFLMKNFSLSFL